MPSNLHAVLHQYAFFTSVKWARQNRAVFQASQDQKAQGGQRDESDHREFPDNRVHVDLRASPGLRVRSGRKAPPVRPDPLALRVNQALQEVS